MRWLRRGRERTGDDPRVCAECGRGFGDGEKAYDARLEGVGTVYWFHRECSERGWGYDPETGETVERD